MTSSIYRDLIDEKVAEWQAKLQKLEEIQKAAESKESSKLDATISNMRSKVESATAQLLILDKSESVANTVETKDKILGIFTAIDKDFPRIDNQTPYML